MKNKLTTNSFVLVTVLYCGCEKGEKKKAAENGDLCQK